ncbi:conserved repeat protein, partial [Methanobrevibacter smithii DSM 2374]
GVDIGAGSSFDLTVTAVADEYGVLTNDVTVGDKRASVDVTVPEIIPAKSVDVENPNFNDEITYTVTVTNNGVVDAKQVVVVDTLDEGLTFVSASDNGVWNPFKRTVTWTVDLAKGESKVFTVIATVSAYGNIPNTVSVGDKSSSVNIAVPEIIPGKTVDVENPNFGDTVTYTVVVTNNGVVDAKQVVVRDILDKGLKFVKATGEYTFDEDSRTVTWIIDLAKGESQTFYVTAVAEAYGVLINDVTVGDNTASADVVVPEINPDKTANITNPNFGDKVDYTVTVTNDGIGDANNVVIVDRLGEGLTFVSASDNGVWDPVKRTVTWIVDLAKGESKVFSVIATVSGYGNVTNSLVVGNKTASVNVTVPEIIPDKTANITNPNFGDNVTYTVTVTNDGIGDAKDVVVRDVLGEGLKFVSATGNYSFDEATRTVTWIVDLAKGESRTFYVNTIVSGYGNVTNSLVVGNKTTGVNVTVPEIIPDKTANISNPNFGDNVNYTVTVTNDGIGDAKDVVVRDVLGEGLKFVSATGNYTFDEVTHTVTWIVDLAKGESKVFSVIATVSGYGNVTNSLVVGNKTAGVNVTVPEIIPDKTVDNEIPNFGDNVTYTVKVTNDGIGDANNVVITDVLDKGLKFLNATGNFTYDEKTGTITWTVDLDKGETKTFNVNVTVLGYGVLPNTVAVGNKTAVRNITVPEIITVKEVNSSAIHIGDEITYTITVSNSGKINATNVVIRDILPEGLKFINASNGGVYDPVTGIITWILNITANSTVDLTVDVCVNKSGNITNTVNVGNKTSNCTIESGDIVDLEIHIVADKSEIYVGDNIVYTVTVINNGPSDAINTIANILIPNALSMFSYNATKGTFDITSGNWSIGNLTNGEKVVLIFVANALNEGNSTVYVNVTSETFEVIMENNYDNVTVKVLKKAAPIGPDKQVHPDGSSSDNECGKSVNLPNTGNPLVMLLLCILSVIFVGSRKRKL